MNKNDFEPTVGEWLNSLPVWNQFVFTILSSVSRGRLDYFLFRVMGYHRWAARHHGK